MAFPLRKLRTVTLAAAAVAVASGQVAPADPAVRVAPPARISEFKAQPASIQPGKSATLVWSTENPYSVSIDPAPGRVTPRGSIQVTPKATTTYTLTVGGPNNSRLTKEVTVTVAGTTPVKGVTTAPARTVARTPDGRPDLAGVYNFSVGRVGALAEFGPELKPGMEKYIVARPANDPGPLSGCMPIIGPSAFGVPYPFQIMQSANYVVIFHEFPGVFRIIPTNGAAHPVDPDPTWLGDSVGVWEKDTLVVDTVGFNTKTELNGVMHSETLHVVEKFSRPAYDSLQYQATYEDPVVFAKPWTISRTFALRPELEKIDPFVCENKKDYTGLFGKK